MALLVKTYNLDPNTDNHVDNELGLRFSKQQLQVPDALGRPRAGATWLLLHPRSSTEPHYRRYVIGSLTLTQTAGSGVDQIKGRGQIALTGHRILGVVTDGAHGSETLSEAAGRVTAFSLDRSDIALAKFPTNWRGRPKRVILGMSSTNSRPLDIALDIQIVVMTITNGKAAPSTVTAFVKALDDEAAKELL
jgi:hypothetical protein